MAKDKRRSMHATTKYVDAPFFSKKTLKVTTCEDKYQAFVRALFLHNHHGLCLSNYFEYCNRSGRCAGDILTRCCYVKWWDKFAHTQSIITNVARDFPSPSASPLRITTPMQKAVIGAPVSSSTKSGKPPAKTKKKSSPLDAIRKDPDALYALLTKMVKEDEAADSDDERSSQASVSRDPYYPYNQEWFGHDDEDADDLAKD